MSDYHCYIVDDEADSIEILEDYINQTPNLSLKHSTTNPRRILNVINKPGPPKITFLDIEMPGINGLELASLINIHTAIIFVTSHSHHALEAFERDAYDYLVKPVSYPRFLKAVIKVQSRIQNNELFQPTEKDLIFVKGNKTGELFRVFTDEIILIESMQNYVQIHTPSGVRITHLTLKECGFRFDGHKYLQVHKRYMINIERVIKYSYNGLTMENNVVVPIGSSYQSELNIRLKDMIFARDQNKGRDD